MMNLTSSCARLILTYNYLTHEHGRFVYYITLYADEYFIIASNGFNEDILVDGWEGLKDFFTI